MTNKELMDKIKREIPPKERRKIMNDVLYDMGYDGLGDFLNNVIGEKKEEKINPDDKKRGLL